MTVEGLHHITCISGDAQDNYDFYTDVLGLDLVKQTVNHDDPESYHLYYGNEDELETFLSFFIIPGLRQGKTGQGACSNIILEIPSGTLNYWKNRLENHDISVNTKKEEEGKLRFYDAEGLHIVLEEGKKEAASNDIIGVNGFHYHSRKPKETQTLLEKIGFDIVEEQSGFTLMDNGKYDVKIQKNFNIPLGFRGSGSVHHVAFKVADEKTLEQVRQELNTTVRVSEIIDRTYFKSIYFKDKGKLLMEIATEKPGMYVDEDELGTSLVLPAWLEDDREAIVDELPALET